MKRIIPLLVFLCFFVISSPALPGTFDFDGYLTYHNDVAVFEFSLFSDASDVRVWTDSFQSGANFDPITALWTSTGDLLAENDDNSSVNPSTQTYWDSGFTLSSLTAGDYFFTVAAYDNFAWGTTLAEGFYYDGDTPIPIEDWWVEAPGYYHVNFDGVDSVTPPPAIPEPATMLLLGSGLIGLAGVGRKKLKK